MRAILPQDVAAGEMPGSRAAEIALHPLPNGGEATSISPAQEIDRPSGRPATARLRSIGGWPAPPAPARMRACLPVQSRARSLRAAFRVPVPPPPMTELSPIVALRGLRLARGERTVLHDVDLTVRPGEVVAILGPSGCGKSTLLAALTGELAPAAGTVEVLGRPMPGGGRALLELRRGIGVMLQGNGLLTDLSVAENVALPLRTHTDLPDAVIRRLVEMKLHAVGLRAAADAMPRELSGGMARRVALARALALDPPLMIYDEPLTGLDPIASGVVMSLVRRLNDTLGLTSIVVTHHVHETLPVADRALVIADGRIVFSGTPAELERSDDAFVQQFLRGAPDGPIAFDAAPRAGAPA
jgi:phospholipid/cholesterol/gamma-HCH transport system ATP-binding protein